MTEHTLDCWAMPECETCGLRKKPYGRSTPLEAANGFCNSDCQGYGQPPLAGHFWSDEELEMKCALEHEQAMKWAGKFPTINGHYWWRNGSADPDPVPCFIDLGDNTITPIGDDTGMTLSGLKHAESLGPIRPAHAELLTDLAAALTELMTWGVELDDKRLRYISVQVNRDAVGDAQRVLERAKQVEGRG